MKTIDNLLKYYNVKTYKETKEGLIAIHKQVDCGNGFNWHWLYFRSNGNEYQLSGSTDHFEK